MLNKIALLHLNLAELLQESLEVTNDDFGKDIGVIKSALSELENPEDISVSNLSRYIKALGGNLKIVADFPDKEIVISQFE
ncbi:transcriptional regulator [Argonema galeatum]|uniref:transcriptional regulator n=1 Tax=Argonema galeatum TaxID=2942762 RepID=UPI002012C06C|nr:transcriptional regulator [Argonema galeatum]MCL1466540.1 transcriptional regulator [Argonema galeatum A003/A1]